MFDMDRQITLRGTLKELQWTNPHIWLQVVVRDAETGQEVEWSIEGASPNMLRRRGWTRNSVAVGAEVELVVFPVKVGGKPNTGSLSSLKADGKPIFNRQDGPQEDAGR